jgi:Fe-S-cluster containining protein
MTESIKLGTSEVVATWLKTAEAEEVVQFKTLVGADIKTLLALPKRDRLPRTVKELDRRIAAASEGAAVSCRQGCAHCCYLYVDITWAEARTLVAAARAGDVTIDQTLLQIQSNYTTQTWMDLPFALRRCVFLTPDHACAVYVHRPMVCRKYAVVSDPDSCNTETNPDGTVHQLVRHAAEALYSAYGAVETEHGGLAAQLLKALQRKKPRKAQ